MVKLTQNVEAAYEPESAYANAPGSNLYHLGLLDTFDPRQVERSVTPVPSLGQSTDTHHAKGPLGVTLPIKVACQGTGWKQLLGRAIGESTLASYKHGNKLTTSVDSLAVLARETGGDFTLVTGVVPNEVTLAVDYTTGGFVTCEATCTGFFTLDESDANFDGFLGDDYSSVTFPAAPSADPLLPTDVSLFVALGGLTKGLSIDGPKGSYVEVGEKYIAAYNANGTLNGDFNSGAPKELNVNIGTLSSAIDGYANWGSAVLGGGSGEVSKNLQKGIFKTSDQIDDDADSTDTGLASIFAGVDGSGGGPAAMTSIKTVELKIANNNTPISGKATGDDGSTEFLLNNKISRGKADITLDITMTAENEDFYDLYVSGGNIPLMRLDFGSEGSIALTNGTITAFSRPLAPGAEIVDTMTIKFRGAGNYNNYSAYAISSNITLTP